tara:strand:- start:122 stop:1516 length:1395 start_codon:yes stop_codon:yes gene_type:complete
MNVAEIRQRIFDQMDYSPDLQQYRDSIVRRMNDRYQELCDSAHWLFLQKERQITLRKAVEGSSADSIGIQVTSSTNPRKATAVGFTPTLEMEGQTLTQTTDGTEFRIIRVEQDSSVSSTYYLYLDKDWDGLGNSSTETIFKITFQRFALPEDCVEVLGYIDRDDDRGRLSFIGRRKEEHAYLDADNTGEPNTVIEDEHILDEPPINTPTPQNFLASPTPNRLLNGTTYEYRYTIYREGRESPPSLSVQFSVPSTGYNGVKLKDLDDTGFYASSTAVSTTDSGMFKLIYRRDVTNDGKWMLVGTAASNITTFTDDELHPKSTFAYQNSASYRFSNSTDVLRFVDSGPRQYVRFYYTPSADRDIHIRYHYRPRDLVSDNDAPALPRQYHMLLVYMTLQDMFLQMQDTVQSQLFERRAEQVKIQMRRRYLARDDEKKRFGRWDRPRGGRDRGIPTYISNSPQYDIIL